MPDRLGDKIGPYFPRLSHPYRTLAFIAPRPSNAGVAEEPVEYEKLAPLMQSRSCPRMRPEHLSGLNDDRSKCQRAHRHVALGKAATPLRGGLLGVSEDGNLGDQEMVLGNGVLRRPVTGRGALCERGADDGDRRASAL